jgi:hypothetical protein
VEVAEQQLLRVAQVRAAPRQPALPCVQRGQLQCGLVLRSQLEKLRFHRRSDAAGHTAQLERELRL